MKTFARIQDGLVVELLTTDRDITTLFNPALIWVDASATPGVADGWQYGSNGFSPPAPPIAVPISVTIPELQAQISILTAQLAALAKAS